MKSLEGTPTQHNYCCAHTFNRLPDSVWDNYITSRRENMEINWIVDSLCQTHLNLSGFCLTSLGIRFHKHDTLSVVTMRHCRQAHTLMHLTPPCNHYQVCVVVDVVVVVSSVSHREDLRRRLPLRSTCHLPLHLYPFANP